MPYIFGKLWHLAIIWAIWKAFQCILQGVRFLLANHTRLSPTSENESYLMLFSSSLNLRIFLILSNSPSPPIHPHWNGARITQSEFLSCEGWGWWGSIFVDKPESFSIHSMIQQPSDPRRGVNVEHNCQKGLFSSCRNERTRPKRTRGRAAFSERQEPTSVFNPPPPPSNKYWLPPKIVS